MVITNEKNLPQSIVNAVDPNPHNKEGCISVTTLLKGSKEYLLTTRHWDEITVDASSRAYAILGTAAHLVFEKGSDKPGVLKEYPVETVVGDYTVTGRVDYYDKDEKLLGDYKTTSVFKVKDGLPEEWRKQGIMYAYLLSLKDMPVEKITFFVFLRDWRRSEYKAKKEQGYPDAQTVTLSFDVTDADLKEAKEFIESKVAEITNYSVLSDDDIPPCSMSERWENPTTYAVKKEGLKTAVRGASKFTTEEEAQSFINMQTKDKEKYSIEKRSGTPNKCLDYCDCCEFCQFYKEHILQNIETQEIA